MKRLLPKNFSDFKNVCIKTLPEIGVCILSVLWIILLVVIFVLVIVRIYLFLDDEDSLVRIVQCVGLLLILYGVFLLEGSQSSLIQIQDIDPEVIKPFVQQYADGTASRKIIKLVECVQEQQSGDKSGVLRSSGFMGNFLAGRQILTIFLVIGFAEIFRNIVPAPDTAIALGSYKIPKDSIGDFLLFGTLSHYLVATVFQAWVAQLTPKLLAGKRSIQFLNLGFAIPVVRLSVFLGKTQAGAPARFLGWVAQIVFRKFLSDEARQVGRKRLFEEQIQYYGFYIDRRTITLNISAENTTVSDISEYIFLERTVDDIRHVATLIGEPKGLRLETALGEQNIHGTSLKGVEISSVQSMIFPTFVGDLTELDSGREPTLSLLMEVLVRRSAESTAEISDPASYEESLVDRLTFTATYQTKAINAEPGFENAVLIDNTRPTKSTKIVLVVGGDLHIGNANVRAQIIEGGITTQEFSGMPVKIDKNRRIIEKESQQREIEILYLPPGTRYEISFKLAAKPSVVDKA